MKYQHAETTAPSEPDDDDDVDEHDDSDDEDELEELDLGCLMSPGSLFQLSASHQSEYCQVVSQDED